MCTRVTTRRVRVPDRACPRGGGAGSRRAIPAGTARPVRPADGRGILGRTRRATAVGLIETRNDGVVIELSVRQRAGRCRVGGVSGGRLRVEVTAAPEDGEATRQALATLAQAVGARAADATLLKGARERHKTVRIDGVTEARCRERLGLDP